MKKEKKRKKRMDNKKKKIKKRSKKGKEKKGRKKYILSSMQHPGIMEYITGSLPGPLGSTCLHSDIVLLSTNTRLGESPKNGFCSH